MTPYQHTQIKKVIDCLKAIRYDVCAMCQSWSTRAEYLPESERLAANEFYLQSDLNLNARNLYDLTSGIDLLAEVEQGEYTPAMMRAALNEIDITWDKIDNWFFGAEESAINEFLRNDIETIRDSIRIVQYHFDQVVYPVPAPISPGLATARPTEKPLYKSFEDLFNNPDDIAPCVEALRSYEKGLSRKGEFKKFVVLTWIDYLYDIKKIRSCDFKIVAPVLANEFSGFTIPKRTTYSTAKGSAEAKKYFIMQILQ